MRIILALSSIVVVASLSGLVACLQATSELHDNVKDLRQQQQQDSAKLREHLGQLVSPIVDRLQNLEGRLSRLEIAATPEPASDETQDERDKYNLELGNRYQPIDGSTSHTGGDSRFLSPSEFQKESSLPADAFCVRRWNGKVMGLHFQKKQSFTKDEIDIVYELIQLYEQHLSLKEDFVAAALDRGDYIAFDPQNHEKIKADLTANSKKVIIVDAPNSDGKVVVDVTEIKPELTEIINEIGDLQRVLGDSGSMVAGTDYGR